MRTWVLVLSALRVPFTLTHAIDDFSEGIPAARFGLPLLPAAFLLSLGYTGQIAAAALSARRVVRADALNLLLGFVWLVAATTDHLGEVLFVPTGAYRAGLVSKGPERQLEGAQQAEPARVAGGAVVCVSRSREWVANSPFPVVTIIGLDDSAQTFSGLYADARGVSRVYQMSLTDGIWKMWREAPGFFQRFTGTFSADGNTISASWQGSRDGSNWQPDFELTYTKIR